LYLSSLSEYIAWPYRWQNQPLVVKGAQIGLKTFKWGLKTLLEYLVKFEV